MMELKKVEKVFEGKQELFLRSLQKIVETDVIEFDVEVNTVTGDRLPLKRKVERAALKSVEDQIPRWGATDIETIYEGFLVWEGAHHYRIRLARMPGGGIEQFEIGG
ncbi:hypothetical protein ES705_20564 [subsurface metagenome]